MQNDLQQKKWKWYKCTEKIIILRFKARTTQQRQLSSQWGNSGEIKMDRDVPLNMTFFEFEGSLDCWEYQGNSKIMNNIQCETLVHKPNSPKANKLAIAELGIQKDQNKDIPEFDGLKYNSEKLGFGSRRKHMDPQSEKPSPTDDTIYISNCWWLKREREQFKDIHDLCFQINRDNISKSVTSKSQTGRPFL